MPSIDWNRAGEGNENICAVVNDFKGKDYIDHDVLDELDGTPLSTFRTWLEQYIAPLATEEISWQVKRSNDDDAQEEPLVLKHFTGSAAPAKVVAHVSSRGDRVEYWTAVPKEEKEGIFRFSQELVDDYLALISTADQQHVLIVGCSGAHPMVCCDLLFFQNSDGSTFTKFLHEHSHNAPDLIRGIMDLAEEYIYRQEH